MSIAVIGSLNVDLVTYTPRLPAGGETMTASGFTTSLGGKGANQAVACAKLSRSKGSTDSTDSSRGQGRAHVRMVGAVGDDAYGAMMRDGLAAVGVDVTGVAVRPDAKTGVAVILVEETTGENRILLSPEANATVTADALDVLLAEDTEDTKETRGTIDLLVLQLEIPLETVLLILDSAHRRGIPVLLNPAPAQPLPDAAYGCVSTLVVNESEAAVLSGIPAADLDLATEAGLARTADVFHRRGTPCVLITLGSQGVYFSERRDRHRTGNSRSGRVAAEKARVVDTTAAGDTFVGAYAVALVLAAGHEFDVEQAVRAANRAAAKTVERRGAQASIPWADEL